MASPSLFEMLPDEILLKICRYLAGADVLYSFYDLNTRLNITITGYCCYVNLGGMPYQRYDYVVCDILPRIASSIQSFSFHTYREKLMSPRAFDFCYTSPISFTFPLLQRITLHWFSGKELSSFIDGIRDLSYLVELNIGYVTEVIEKTLLIQILTANNNRLGSITFDQDSASVNVTEDQQTVSCLNIQKLTIKITTSKMLPHLFALVPNVCRLNVTIDDSSDEWNFIETFVNLSPLIHLTDFHLDDVDSLWDLDGIDIVLRQMPSLKTLTLHLRTSDERLIQQEHFVKILPPSLKEINFLIHYYFNEATFDVNSQVASWAFFLPINCLLDEAHECILMFTTSVILRSLDLPAAISKQIQCGFKYIPRVEKLYVYNSTSLIDILATVQHFHNLQKLCINASKISETCVLAPLKQSPTLNLSHLKGLEVIGACALFDILKAAPNLDHLLIYLDTLKILMDDESTCTLLQQRIIRLDVHGWTDIELDLFQRVIDIFRRLRCLCLHLENSIMFTESVLSNILAHSCIKQLDTLSIGGKASDEINTNLRQLVIDHTHLTINDSFGVTYLNNYFFLWQ